MTWPWFVENLWQASADGGLVAWMYAGSTVTAMVGDNSKVTIAEETDYPFTGEIQLRMQTESPVEFPLYLRVPRWCLGMVISVNGEPIDVNAGPGRYVRLARIWADGDLVQIHMPMTLALTTWPRTGSVTIDRGPLSYSVKIDERYERCGGTDEWPEWEIFPASPWNYGLALSSESLITEAVIHERGVDASQPWTLDKAPIEIEVSARRIPEWGLVNETVDVLRTSPVRSDADPGTITLVPLGCARLRMSCLPTIGDDPDARDW
jgi:DUF1680 family protein